MKNIQQFGFDSWFQERSDSEKSAQHEIARVVSVHKESYMVTKGESEVFAELTGRLAYTSDSAEDFPTTGDWVYVDFYDDDTHAIIHDIFPRKTILQRKTSGKTFDIQLIAANIDYAFIIQSLDFNFNLRRLERYLVMINEASITPIILLSKSDLLTEEETQQKVKSVREISANSIIIPFSNESGENIESIKALLEQGKTYCLVGSSGVGKTTLLNSILGDARFETQTVSKKENKGRHTTTCRELILLENGAMLIDTPGMRELGNIAVDSGIDETFSDIVELAKQCKFSNCSHVNESGCAIHAAIEQGELSEKRYQNYLKMKNEAAFNDMSYYEKRQKDKNFGKMVKSVLKSKHRKNRT